jgi:hypothetical protein
MKSIAPLLGIALAFALVHPGAHAQQAFPSADAAAEALVAAIAASDSAALVKILGKDWKTHIPTEGIGREDVTAFLEAYKRSHKIAPDKAGRSMIAVGELGWQLPIPIVPGTAGWRFDVRSGADEMRTRRVGRNEVGAMMAALAYYDAQKEYARTDRNGDGVLEYAQRILSTPGKRDGLFWKAALGEPDSPLGPLLANAKPGQEFYGYHYKILKAQDREAKGGAYDYVINGRMVGGFALIAWPARYGDSGVMSFIVNHDGQVYEKDLGRGTAEAVKATSRFNPDRGWKVVANLPQT